MRKTILFTLILLTLVTGGILAKPEHFGFRFEIMNQNLINLYGLGGYTHTKHADAEILFYFNQRSLDYTFLKAHKEYFSFAASFSFKYRPYVFKSFAPYVGAGTFPFLLRGYYMHYTIGIEFKQKNNFWIDINMKRIYSKEDRDFFQWLPQGWVFCIGFRT
jgi:hypothetical protein